MPFKGDEDGTLRMLVLVRDGTLVKELKLEVLGATVSPSALSYLDDGVVYVGSLYGDSQVCSAARLRSSDGPSW
jgi:DNA damage-binding protein 1